MLQMTRISQTPELIADVVIVGYGPVGATLANLLGLRGVSTLVLEREAGIYHLPRAVHFDDEVMRVFETLGLSEAILPKVILSPGMRFVDRDGKLLVDWSRPPEATPQGWSLSYRFHQPELEEILRHGAERHAGVTIRRRCDAFALDTDDDGVVVRFEDLATGRLQRCRAKYVVGCDGARSLVRRFMGVEMDDLGFHERWLVLDFLLARPRPDLGNFSVQYCDPARPATFVRGTRNRCRWEITLLDDEKTHLMTAPERVWPRARPSTPSTRSWPSAGDRAGCFWQAIPPTRHRPSSDKACARASAMQPISLGSSPTSSQASVRSGCWTAMRANAPLTCGNISREQSSSAASSTPGMRARHWPRWDAGARKR
jgi:3-(3-hydroxy-phenyl)propionate hydroxylase